MKKVVHPTFLSCFNCQSTSLLEENAPEKKADAWVHTHPTSMQGGRSSLPLPLPGGGLYRGGKNRESPATQPKFYMLNNLADTLKAIPFYL